MLQETGTAFRQTKNLEQIIGEQISVQGSFTTGKITSIIYWSRSRKLIFYNLIVLLLALQLMVGIFLIFLTLIKVQNS
jgi:hypothetical protein